VASESCTPTGWNLISTAFTTPELRSLESGTISPELVPADIREEEDVLSRSTRLLPSAEKTKHRLGSRVSGRTSSLSKSYGGGLRDLTGKDYYLPNTSTGKGCVRNNKHYSKRKKSQSDESSCLSSEGVTTCPMGVVVLKGREEYERRGQVSSGSLNTVSSNAECGILSRVRKFGIY
jgi:hypothetical protein